ncbi:19974_t:CDS:2, partial [Dentiscutata erythropus]
LSSTFRGETRSIIAIPKVITLRGRHSADVDLLCANSDGMIISTATDKHITSWDGKQGIYLKKLERYMRRCESFGWAAAGFEDGVIRVWDIHSGQITYILKDTVEDVESVISVMTRNSIRERVTCLQIVVPNSYPKTSFSNNEPGYHTNFKSNSNDKAPAMLLAAYRSGHFREWDIVSGQIVHTIATNQKGGISYLFVVEGKQNYDQDDLRIYTGARDGSVKCWIRTIYHSEDESKSSSSDPSESPKSRWKSFYTIPGELNNVITCIAAKVIKTRNNSLGILVTGASDGEVRVYDYSSGKHIVTLSQGTTGKQRAKEHKQQLLQERLLQRRIIKNQQQFIQSNGQQHNIKSSSQQQFIRSNEETDDDSDLPHHQDAITNIIIHPLKEQSCPCGNAEGTGGFTIVTSSTDEKVRVWQLTRDFMDCTCMALKIGKNNLSQVRNNTGQLHRQVAQWNGVVSYQTKYVGCVSQSGGSAIVLLRENIIGVRHIKPSSTKSKQVPKRCHGAEGEWELWVLDINDPHVIEEKEEHKNSDDDDEVELSVQVLPLSGLRRRASVLHRVYPNNIINDQQLAILNEEDEMNEILPFAYVRQAVKVGDDGVAIAYGNFIKYIQFEEMNDEKK